VQYNAFGVSDLILNVVLSYSNFSVHSWNMYLFLPSFILRTDKYYLYLMLKNLTYWSNLTLPPLNLSECYFLFVFDPF